ncbi:ABC transporter substrate-binding protein [Bacillus sp. 165]|uniref:ABC transporter substrate-binding protein n=1 Tax=Bacillus sp. 165 TaxID=1529117 RepID=UPI001FFE2408|nr:ABC transporter substrate-binding protein [Bacillus sp. 165]
MAGCAAEPKKESEQIQGNTAFPITVTDAMNKEVTIEKKPKRIVSLIPSNTEIAYVLGLENEIVGVSDNDNYPESVNKKEKVGGMEVNIEKVISLQPDLVLAHASAMGTSKEGLQQLESAGIPVVVVNNADNFEDVYKSIQLIGKATGTSDKAATVIQDMKDKLAGIEEKAKTIEESKRANVWIEVSPAPEIYTAAKGTFMNAMLEVIGAKNTASSKEGWVQFTEEEVVKLNPDVIITTYGYYVPNASEQVMNRPAWKNVTAVKEKKVYDVNSDLVTRPGPRVIEGVEDLAKAIYPDTFNK